MLSGVRSPTLVAFGVPESFSMPSSFTRRAEVVGVPTSTSKLLSSMSTITFTGTFIPAYALVSSLILFTIWRTLTPRGPRAGPSGGPAVAFPPSIRASTVFFSPSFLSSFSCQFHIVGMYGDGKCREPFFEQFDHHFLFDLVHVGDLCLQPPERSADDFDHVSDAEFFDYWFGYDEP